MRISDWSSDVCSSDLWCREYANGKNAFVAGVHPKKAGENFEGVPIFGTVKDAKAQTGATVSVIYVPPAGAAAAIWEAVEADLDLVSCLTEGIPVPDMLELRNRIRAQTKKTLLLEDRKSVEEGKSVSVRVELGGRRNNKKKIK